MAIVRPLSDAEISGDPDTWRRAWQEIEAWLPYVPMSKADFYRKSGVSQRTFAKMRRDGVPLASSHKRVAVSRALGMDDDWFDRLVSKDAEVLERALHETYERALEPVTSDGAADALAAVLAPDLPEVSQLPELVADHGERIARLERRVHLLLKGRVEDLEAELRSDDGDATQADES